MFGKAPQNTAANGGTAKPSGMDMMIQSILKGMGVSPDTLTTYIEQGKQLAMQFVTAMQNTSNRLDAIEARQAEILSAVKQLQQTHDAILTRALELEKTE